jgi:hypothetical protein
MKFFFRFLKVLLRGLRPISSSLSRIAVSLETIERIQRIRLEAEGLSLAPRKVFSPDDLTEISYDVKEPEIDSSTGQPKVDDDMFDPISGINWHKIFGLK